MQQHAAEKRLKRFAMNIITKHCTGTVGRERVTLKATFSLELFSLISTVGLTKVQQARKLKNQNIKQSANYTKRAGKKHKTNSPKNANEPKNKKRMYSRQGLYVHFQF